MTGIPGDHRLLVEPRHPVVADVEPAVDARGRPRQHEQQRGDVQREVAAAVQPDARERERGDRAQRAGQPGERAELHRPLRRRERQQQQPDGGRPDQPPHRARCAIPGTPPRRSRTVIIPNRQSSSTRDREPSGQRRVDTVLDGQEVVAQEVLVPRDRRADDVLDAGRLGDGGQRLVAEHDDEDQSPATPAARRSAQGGRRRRDAGAMMRATARAPTSSGRQRDQPLRRHRRGERGDDDRDRGRPQPPGGDRVLDEHPGQQRAERDERLRAAARC